eukprot:TRINITY_DN3796_c0_g1_i1.p1 TRINITY_DN3796_c0_g1~~TRINITY_DN3796_c0_g1_i1.p1  ORF type:complete len:482 (-),score=109.56 TRINITY_DN3796_c0_g1_i1:33-1376(-)
MVQNLQSELNEADGLMSLAVLNLFASICTFFVAPGLVEKLGEQRCMMFSSFGVALYAYLAAPGASLTWLSVGALVAGFCQGLLWVSAYVYISASSTEDDRPKLLAHFLMILSVSHFVANIITALIQVFAGDYYKKPTDEYLQLKEEDSSIPGGYSFKWMFIIDALIICGSSFAFLFLRDFIRPEGIEHHAREFSSSETFGMMKNGLVNLYVPMAVASGFSMTIVYGDIPNFINNTLYSAWSLTAFGGAHFAWIIASKLIANKASDSVLFVLSAVSLPLVVVFSSMASNSWWYFLGAAICMGFVDSSITTQLGHIFARDFSDRIPACMSLTLGFTFIGLMFGFFVSSVANFKEKLILSCVLHGACVVLAIVQGVRRRAVQTDALDDDPGYTLGQYNSAAVLEAVKESQEKSEYEFEFEQEDKKGLQDKKKGKGKGKQKSDYDEFGANY